MIEFVFEFLSDSLWILCRVCKKWDTVCTKNSRTSSQLWKLWTTSKTGWTPESKTDSGLSFLSWKQIGKYRSLINIKDHVFHNAPLDTVLPKNRRGRHNGFDFTLSGSDSEISGQIGEKYFTVPLQGGMSTLIFDDGNVFVGQSNFYRGSLTWSLQTWNLENKSSRNKTKNWDFPLKRVPGMGETWDLVPIGAKQQRDILWFMFSSHVQKWEIQGTQPKFLTSLDFSLSSDNDFNDSNDFRHLAIDKNWVYVLSKNKIRAYSTATNLFAKLFVFDLHAVLDISGVESVSRIFVLCNNIFVFVGNWKANKNKNKTQDTLLKLQIRMDSRLPDHSAKCRFRIFRPQNNSPEEQEKCMKWILEEPDLIPFYFTHKRKSWIF